jgi:hypothetical protein
MRTSPLMRRILAVVDTREVERILEARDSDKFAEVTLDTPEEQLEELRMKLRRGLTHMQRLFLYGKLGGLNDKDAALAAGYSLSVAKNTRQKIWKPRVADEFASIKCHLSNSISR